MDTLNLNCLAKNLQQQQNLQFINFMRNSYDKICITYFYGFCFWMENKNNRNILRVPFLYCFKTSAKSLTTLNILLRHKFYWGSCIISAFCQPCLVTATIYSFIAVLKSQLQIVWIFDNIYCQLLSYVMLVA